jgi:hypothetical protein
MRLLHGPWDVRCALFALLIALGCSTLEHGYGASEFHGRTLDTATAAGGERLRLEIEYDSAVRELVQARGRPDFVHLVDRETLYLYYRKADVVVMVRRMLVPPGELRVFERTPGNLLALLPQPTIDAILAQREARRRARRIEAARNRSAGAHPKQARSRAKASPKSSRARSAAARHDNGTRFGDFEPNRIVERLRASLSAADPGVSGWRHYTLPDGRAALRAHAGATTYQVRPDSVSVRSPIGVRRKTPPARARNAVFRVNQAIFGTRATAVTRQAETLLSRVAADTSGRTRFVRRMAGRTIEIARDAPSGLLLYAVRAN